MRSRLGDVLSTAFSGMTGNQACDNDNRDNQLTRYPNTGWHVYGDRRHALFPKHAAKCCGGHRRHRHLKRFLRSPISDEPRDCELFAVAEGISPFTKRGPNRRQEAAPCIYRDDRG